MNTTQHADYLTRYTLLKRVQRPNDEAAWNDFMNQYRRYIYSIIHRMKIRPSDADDVYQKVVVKLWKKLPEMDVQKMEYFRGYLAAVVRNAVNDYYRKIQREVRRDEDFLQSDAFLNRQMNLPEIEQVIETEWHHYLAVESLENVSAFFSDRAMTLFKRTLGEDIKAVAADMGIPLSTAYRLNSRVKEALRKEIDALSNFLDG